MKKFLAGLVVLFVLMISVPLEADAQSRCRKKRSYASKIYNRGNYRNVSRYGYKNSNYNRPNSEVLAPASQLN